MGKKKIANEKQVAKLVKIFFQLYGMSSVTTQILLGYYKVTFFYALDKFMQTHQNGP